MRSTGARPPGSLGTARFVLPIYACTSCSARLTGERRRPQIGHLSSIPGVLASRGILDLPRTGDRRRSNQPLRGRDMGRPCRRNPWAEIRIPAQRIQPARGTRRTYARNPADHWRMLSTSALHLCSSGLPLGGAFRPCRIMRRMHRRRPRSGRAMGRGRLEAIPRRRSSRSRLGFPNLPGYRLSAKGPPPQPRNTDCGPWEVDPV